MKNHIQIKPSFGKYGQQSITKEQAKALGITEAQISAGTARGKHKSFGPWHIVTAYLPAALVSGFGEDTIYYPARTLHDVQPIGYELEGRVHLNGKRYRGFTTSQILEIGDILVDIALVHVCTDQPK